jgi:hypothetical protein
MLTLLNGGIIVGFAVQYTVSACCNDAGRAPEMVTVAFVPTMKHCCHKYAGYAHRR